MTVVTFHVGSVLCGAEVSCVQEVLRHQELTPIPLAAAATPGLLHLRGQILTAIDLRSVFDLPKREESAKPVCVIVREGEGAASLLADRIGEVVEVKQDTIVSPPAHWQGPMREFLRGVTDRSDQLLLLLDTARILAIESSTESPQDEIAAV
jgi:purine-binding chemotaxis protein CheW